MNKKSIIAASGILCSALLCQCSVEEYALDDLQTDSLQIKTGVTAPIGSSNIEMADLIKKQNIEGLDWYNDGLLYFGYDTSTTIKIDSYELEELDIKTAVKPANIIIKENGANGAEKYITEGNMNFNKGDVLMCPFRIPLDINGEGIKSRIDSVILSKAKIKVQFSTNIKNLTGATDISFEIKDAKKHKDPFTAIASAEGGLFDLDDVQLNPKGKDSIDCVLYLKLTKNTVLTFASDSRIYISADTKGYPMKFSTMWGILNSDKTQTESTSINIDIYKDVNFDLNLKVADPKITIYALSNIGLPLIFNIESLKAESYEGKVIESTFKNGEKSYSIVTDYNTIIGDIKRIFEETFDKDNGRIDKIVNSRPRSIDLSYSLATKETPLDQEGNYFFRNDSKLTVDMKVEIPAHFKKGTYITVNDTIEDVDLDEYIGKSVNIDKVKLKGDFVNNLPFDAFVNVQFYTIDTIKHRMVVIEEGIDRTIELKAASVDPVTHVVNKASNSNTIIEYSAKDTEALKKVKGMFLTYTIKADDKNDEFKVNNKNAISAKLSAFVKGDVLINQIED